MRKWQAYYEVLFFPMILLFIACVLKSLGGLVLSTTFQVYFHITNRWVIFGAECLRYMGEYLIRSFPFLVMIKNLAQKFEDEIPVFIGIVSYCLFHIASMFFARTNMMSSAYYAELGIQMNSGGMRYPVATGILAALIVNYLTSRFYINSRHANNIGIFAFVNRDATAMLMTGAASLVSGALCALAWPYFLQGCFAVFNIISSDITNPMSLFIYGVLERLMTMLGQDRIIHSVFWFGEQGGSWINNGITYLGDISVWTAQTAAGHYNTGFGRFITPVYVQNIFLVPAIILATYRTFTDKMERHKYSLFMVLAILISIFCGNILPVEVYLMIMTPLFYAFHVFSTGMLYAVLQAFAVNIGYSYTGTLANATPGSAFNLIINLSNSNLFPKITLMFLIGFFFALLYYGVMTYYYRKGCVDILQTGKKEEYINTFITAIGGLENVVNIYSTPTKVILQVDDAGLLNFNTMQKQGASKIIQTTTTYDLSYGAISYLIAQEVNKRLTALRQM